MPARRKKPKKAPRSFEVEMLAISVLKPHPGNYKVHPEEQLKHIASSIEQTGFYRNVVIARDGTILAGHGVVLASAQLGLTEVPCVRLDLASDSARALKVLALDNELGKFAETDDRALTELLRVVREKDDLGLLGTGFDDQMLSALLMVTRPVSEVANMNEAAEWLGMPEYHNAEGDWLQLTVTFRSEEDRARFIEEKQIEVMKKSRGTWSARWPSTGWEDALCVLRSIRDVERGWSEAGADATA